MSTTAGTQGDEPAKARHVGDWELPVVVDGSEFKHKSLCCWSVNAAMGCLHGCTFCYVPSVSANKQKRNLQPRGVNDPGGEWGQYGFLRPWNEDEFLSSLRSAENRARSKLNPDGNRAVMYSSTTDPYQAWPTPELRTRARFIMRHSLELIRDQSTLNVRILTRSPLAKKDFELYRTFGHRLVFCMSLPTLNNRLARMYEPNAPAPTQRLKTLQEAKKAGLHVGVAIAPTYPECDEADLRATLEAAKALDPVTIYHEPINTRADNVRRMEARASELGVALNTGVYETTETWVAYQLQALRTVEGLAGEMGLEPKLKLWIDERLAKKGVTEAQPDPEAYAAWVKRWQGRIADWPKQAAAPVVTAPQRSVRKKAKVTGQAKQLPVASRNPAGTRLYYRPDVMNPLPEERVATKFIFFVPTTELKALAGGYVDALEWIDWTVGSAGDFPQEVRLKFSGLAQTRAVAGDLEVLLEERHWGEQGTAESLRQMARQIHGRTVTMTIHDFIAWEYDFRNLADEIRNTKREPVKRPWRVWALVKHYLKLLTQHPPASISLGENSLAEADEQAFRAELVDEQRKALRFLEALGRRSPTQPEPPSTEPIYVIRIDQNQDVISNHVPLILNHAQRRALYSLMVLGTTNFSTERFARLYQARRRAWGPSQSFTNTTRSGLMSLGRALPQMRLQSMSEGRYSVFGLKFKNVDPVPLEAWLRQQR